MKRIILLMCVLSWSFGLIAQKKKPVEYILEVDNDHRHSGWYIGAGPTYMFSNPGSFTRSDTISPGVSYTGEYNGKGKIGINLELGGYHIFDHGFIHFIDYGFHYRSFKAEEEYLGTLNDNADPNLEQTISGLGKLDQSLVGVGFGFNRLMGVNRYFFIQHNINFNLNYRLSEATSFNGTLNPSSLYQPNGDFQGDASYKFGVGYRTRKGLLILSSSLPVYSSYDTKEILSRQSIIHSQYHPIVFSLRYMWLRRNPDRKCPDNRKTTKKKKEKLFDRKVLKTR